MLAIRMQRTGRKKLAQYRVIVQESQFSPNSGRVVANLGHYNPHTKETVIDAEKASEYLKNGAQPSERVVKLFTDQKIKLPNWVSKIDNKKKSETKNPEKLRKNQPEEPKEEVKAEELKEEAKAEESPKPDTEAVETTEDTKESESTKEEKPEEKIEESSEEPKEEAEKVSDEAEEEKSAS